MSVLSIGLAGAGFGLILFACAARFGLYLHSSSPLVLDANEGLRYEKAIAEKRKNLEAKRSAKPSSIPPSAEKAGEASLIKPSKKASPQLEAKPNAPPAPISQEKPRPKEAVQSPAQTEQARPESEPLTPANSFATSEAAAEHHRRTSVVRRRDEVSAAYKEYCDRIAKQFGLPSWSPPNQVTRMVTSNAGDTEPFKKADAELPYTAWFAVRVVVAYETHGAKPMYMSYVFIGRTTSGEEVVALFDSEKQWKILSHSSSEKVDHEKLMVDTIRKELQRLDEKIAIDIRRLP